MKLGLSTIRFYFLDKDFFFIGLVLLVGVLYLHGHPRFIVGVDV